MATRLVRACFERLASLRLGGMAAVWGLTGLLMVLAAGVAGTVLPVHAVVAPPLRIPWPVLALGFGAAEVGVVHVYFRREAQSFSLSEIPLVVGLFLAAPPALVLAQLAGGGAALLLHRRQFGIKLVFNLAQFGFGNAVACVVFAALVGGDPVGPRGWVAALAGVAASAVVSDTVIFCAISLSEGSWQRGRLPEMLVPSLLAGGANASVALVAVRALWRDPAALLLLTSPVLLVLWAYRAYVASRQQYRNLEVLYDAARLLSRSGTSELTLVTLLEQVRGAFRADVAEIRLFSSDARQHLRTSLRGDKEAQIMFPVDPDDGATAWMSDESVVVWRARDGAEDALGRGFAAHGFKDVMVAPLLGEERRLGCLLVADRLGEKTTFGADDARLFELLARQVGAALENSRLEESLARLQELKERLRHQALHDGLTGLPNRTLFNDCLERACQRPAGRVAVAFVDLDDFKLVNDSFGHDAGDQLLVAVAERLRRCLRPNDTAARLAGDEFAVLLEDAGSDAEVADLAQRLVDALSAPFSLLGQRVCVGASVGVAVGESGTAEAVDLLRHADVAMYRAKRSGKRGYALYRGELEADRLQSVGVLAESEGRLPRAAYEPG